MTVLDGMVEQLMLLGCVYAGDGTILAMRDDTSKNMHSRVCMMLALHSTFLVRELPSLEGCCVRGRADASQKL